ncbi:ATP-binding protein [Phycicoccus sp. SLBN-51]|jgi:K+-sensing histidine kinase KdpD|uniref:sensor histidine kinase n=1 Tax=Phycicoccus sp. SLBN-51 TaxID=2768447 RepID=UPI001154DF9E|nr:ATP-binding protein [Phycicoccus sp. SLBN-51]TQJ52160.1 phospho-acceptor domain-containing protein [Phycicoccus sp. SLBN-51]
MAPLPGEPRGRRAASAQVWTGRGLTPRRQLSAVALAAVGLPLLTLAAANRATTPTTESALLVYLLLIVVVCVIGGLLPGLLAAVAAFLLANWFLTPPVNTFSVTSTSDLADLVVFLLVAAIVSVMVEAGARNRARAAHHRLEARIVRRLGEAELRGVTPEQILDQVRDVYGMRTVTLLGPDGRRPAVTVGPPPGDDAILSVEVGGTPRLLGYGPTPFAEDRLLLRALAEAAARVWDRQELAAEAARVEQLEQTDRVRSALLTAVSHDLRTPIASIKTAASGLHHDAIALTEADRRELLEAIEEGADRLAALVDDLLAMSRIQAGAVPLTLEPVSLEEVLARATPGVEEGRVEVAVPEDLPLVRADAVLLERVVANIVENALRFEPPGVPVHVDAAVAYGQPDVVELRVVDRGPGVPSGRHDEMFVPFQRLGDTSPQGVGLGLAIARGLAEAMGGSVTPSGTPGGGLTMTVRLPVTS